MILFYSIITNSIINNYIYSIFTQYYITIILYYYYIISYYYILYK